MQPIGIDLLARTLALSRSRRQALIIALAMVVGGDRHRVAAGGKSKARAQQRTRIGSGFPRKCRHFVIAAGPNRSDRFQHTDDDLLIEVIPKNGGPAEVVFNDDNDSANGDNGEHLSVAPFTARVGDQIHIVARNEVPGGCELDEIWLHCIERRGGRVKLTDRILPEDCQADADRVGVFFETTVRIRNK